MLILLVHLCIDWCSYNQLILRRLMLIQPFFGVFILSLDLCVLFLYCVPLISTDLHRAHGGHRGERRAADRCHRCFTRCTATRAVVRCPCVSAVCCPLSVWVRAGPVGQWVRASVRVSGCPCHVRSSVSPCQWYPVLDSIVCPLSVECRDIPVSST